jgi:hypothetical protein
VEQVKKELFEASLLAVALAAVLGTISYKLFAETPLDARIDFFSKKNGTVSFSFLPGDEVLLEARTSYRNAPIADVPVTFEVKTPNDTDFLLPARNTLLTDKLGTANLTFQIPWPSNFSLGPWHATVTGQIYGQNVNATTEFDCKLVPPAADVYTQKGGRGQNMPGGTYKLNESMLLYAEVRDPLNRTMPNILVLFDIKFLNATSVPWTEVLFVQMTNASGIATEIMRIPPVAEYAGTWAVYVKAGYNDTVLIDTLIFKAEQ